jgi:hypothetical protein
MVVRESQIAAFQEQNLGRFENETVQRLRAGHPEETAEMTDVELRQLAADGVPVAFSYGITLESDVARFLEYLFLYGADFYDQPKFQWARNILTSTKLNGTEKMDWMDKLDYMVRSL